MRHTRRYLAAALALNYAAMMMLAVAVNFLPVFLTTVRSDLGGLTNEQLGRSGSVTFFGLFIGIILTGPIADRWGTKLLAAGGNLLVAVGLAMLGFSGSYPVLLLAVFVMGLGAGMLDMVLSPIVAALQPHRRTAAMNWLHSFYGAGAVLAVLAGALALRQGVGWRTLSLAVIPFPAFIGIGFLLLKIPPLVPEHAGRTDLGRLMREPFFRVALLAIFFAGATELGMAQWLPAYAETELGYSKWTAGMLLVAFSMAITLGRVAMGLVGDRWSGTSLMLVGCWASVAAFIVACYAPWPGVAVAGCLTAGFVGSALWPSMLAVTADRFPYGGATMFGLLASLGNAGGMFMPWGVGAVADQSSLRTGLATATLCPLLMAFCLIYLRRLRQPTSAS
ncbi:MAG TPA: MFS transporter [Tepidisphaeraceae bacterium]